MNRIYLMTWEGKGAVIVARCFQDIDLSKFPGCEVHEIGLSHPETPPGMILGAENPEITRWTPKGRKMMTQAVHDVSARNERDEPDRIN